MLKNKKKHALLCTCLDNQSCRETADLISACISQIYDKKPHKCTIKNLTNVKYKLRI